MLMQAASVGDLALDHALAVARRESLSFRLMQQTTGEPSAAYTRTAFYALGLATGVSIAAEIHLHADPVRSMAVANEIRFLSGRYLEPRA